MLFDPDRWTTEKENISPFSVLPFGHGIRMCYGNVHKYTVLQLTTTTVIIIHVKMILVTKQLLQIVVMCAICNCKKM